MSSRPEDGGPCRLLQRQICLLRDASDQPCMSLAVHTANREHRRTSAVCFSTSLRCNPQTCSEETVVFLRNVLYECREIINSQIVLQYGFEDTALTPNGGAIAGGCQRTRKIGHLAHACQPTFISHRFVGYEVRKPSTIPICIMNQYLPSVGFRWDGERR
jgi:hypothetical protein